MKNQIQLILCFALFILLGSTVFAQDPTSYYGMSGMSKKTLFDDQMDDNRNNWLMGDGDYVTRFEYGYMYYESKVSTPGAKWMDVIINQSGDFEIEARYRYVSGEDNNFVGIAFGSQNPGNKWRFGYAPNGFYTIDKRYNDAWVDIVAWTTTTLISRTDWNTLTVRKVGSNLYYFLNQSLVYTKPFEPFFGDKLGIYTNSNCAVNIDYYKAVQYESSGNMNASNQSLYDNQFDTDKEGWYQDDSEFNIHFESGYMYFQSKCSSPGAKWVNLVIDQSKDFEIETRYRFVSGEDNNFIGLGFGAQNPGNKWRFGFAADGHYTIDKRYSDQWVDIVPWTVTTLISKYDWNTLTVRKTGYTLYYLINGVQVYTKPFEPFFGDKVGLYTNSMTTVNIDYLKVNQGGAQAVASKRVLYDNQFDTDKEGWYQNDSEFDIHFEYGYMYFQSKCTSPGAKWVNLFIDQSKDFEIEARYRFVNGEDNNFIGLGFGAQNPGNKWRFGFTGDGHYTVDKRYNNEWVDIVPWTVSSLISKYDWNTLMVRKTGSTLYYLLNGQQVYTKPFEPFFGDKVGLYTNSMTTVNIDYLTISEIGSGSGYVANNYNQNNYIPNQNNYIQNNVSPKPVITWINPATNGTSSATADFTVRVKVNSTTALSTAVVMVNGFPATQLQMTTVGSDFYYEKQITLAAGNNVIEFKATNSGGEISENRSISFVQQQAYQQQGMQQQGMQPQGMQQQGFQQPMVGKSEVDENIPVNDKVSSRFALIIGNEDYASFQRSLGSESNVEFAVNDATIFKEYCIKTLGLEERNVFFLTNATAGVMSQNIELISKIASKLSGTCEIIFYYAGHGLPDEVTHAPYLIPVDVNAANLAAAIKLNDIYAKFSQCGAKRITVFLDACFSGGGRSAGLLSARSVKVKPKVDVPTGKLIVFTASSGDQSSLPYKEKGHGMFTYWLLKKLQDSQGKVNYGDLSKYLKENVSVESLRTNFKEQDPQVNFSPALQGLWEKYSF